jgi:CRP/FNR family cyclic AMP-dependent transcriptional regulator
MHRGIARIPTSNAKDAASGKNMAGGHGALDARESLRRCPLFVDISGDESVLSEIASECEIVTVKAGDIVFKEGSNGDSLYIMWKGRVRIEKRTPAQDAYTVTILDGCGDFFGELALIDQELRSATIVAESASSFLVMRRERFVDFGNRHPQAGLIVTRRIAEQLGVRLRRAAEDRATLFTALVHEIEQRL